MNVEQELSIIAEKFIAEVQAAMVQLNINASGESSASLRYETKTTDAAIMPTVYGNEGIFFTDKGRGPTKRRTGNGFTKDMAKKWARDKGVGTWYKDTAKGKKAMNADEQAFLIWRKVHQKGFYGDNSQGKEYLEAIRQQTIATIRAEITPSVFELVKSRIIQRNVNKQVAAA